MGLYVVRVWLPDRPGALGQVASRIGGVRGDVVGIEILERGAGRAIDELVVRLPEDGLVDLLVRLYDPWEGQILLDGVDIRDLSLEELRSRYPNVFGGSVPEALAWHRREAEACLSEQNGPAALFHLLHGFATTKGIVDFAW